MGNILSGTHEDSKLILEAFGFTLPCKELMFHLQADRLATVTGTFFVLSGNNKYFMEVIRRYNLVEDLDFRNKQQQLHNKAELEKLGLSRVN